MMNPDSGLMFLATLYTRRVCSTHCLFIVRCFVFRPILYSSRVVSIFVLHSSEFSNKEAACIFIEISAITMMTSFVRRKKIVATDTEARNSHNARTACKTK